MPIVGFLLNRLSNCMIKTAKTMRGKKRWCQHSSRWIISSKLLVTKPLKASEWLRTKYILYSHHFPLFYFVISFSLSTSHRRLCSQFLQFNFPWRTKAPVSDCQRAFWQMAAERSFRRFTQICTLIIIQEQGLIMIRNEKLGWSHATKP